MITILNFCDTHWLLPWLIPFILGTLLGLALGYGLWGKYKTMIADLKNEIASLKKRISSLEDDLAACSSRRASLEGELATANGRVRELDLELNKISKANIGASSLAANIASTSDNSKSGTAVGSEKKASAFAALKEDNLQIIEGIGPKMNSILNDHGIRTWAHLASKSPEDLRNILNEYGDRYRIIDPSTWAAQASLARDGKWEDLITRQKQLDGGKVDGAKGMTDSKLEKVMIKMGLIKRWKQDDLKAIEGIGPKIAGLLNNAGINTWEKLANTSVSDIQKILDDAGSRYSLADPKTWPKQSRMAADGKWDELQEYQDFLQGGKE